MRFLKRVLTEDAPFSFVLGYFTGRVVASAVFIVAFWGA